MLKKLTQALLALTLVGGMTACDKSVKGVDESSTLSTGDTYMSVTFSTANPNSTRAEDSNYNSRGEYKGRDKIKNINVYIVSLPAETVEVKKIVNNNSTTDPNIVKDPDNSADTNDFRTKAWKTTAGVKIVYVYANIAGTDLEKKLDAATSKATLEKVNEEAINLVESGEVNGRYASYDGTYDIIAMNSLEGVKITVKPGVKKEAAEIGTENYAKATVRRLVAQAAVTSKNADYTIEEEFGGTKSYVAKVEDLKWDVMQYEQTTYLAPQPTKVGESALLAKSCKTPSFAFLPTTDNYIGTGAGASYVYRKFNGEAVPTFTRSTNADQKAKNEEDVANIVKNKMKFITETTHQDGPKIEDTSSAYPKTGYRKGNTTYVIVSAKITPEENRWATGEKAKTGEDLYFGVLDHKFYKDLDTAKAANRPISTLDGGRDNVIKYADGRCFYVAWLNPNDKSEPVVSPVLRNNIYHVNITGIKRLGYSGNPFNPNDDDPKDPDDPTPDPEQPLYPIDTHMALEISVVNWGVHSYDREF